MYQTGDSVEMSKGYKGATGVIEGRTDSSFEIYIVRLNTDIRVAAGPSAFVSKKGLTDSRT